MRIALFFFFLFTSLMAIAQLDDCDVTVDITPISCQSAMDGSISVVTNSGGPFLYSWNGGPPSNITTISNLGAASYTVLVVDTVSLCQFYLDTLMPLPGLWFGGGFCPGIAPVINPTLFNGYVPTQFNWNTGETTPSITLPVGFEGPVSVSTVDANGCAFNLSVDIFTLPAPTGEILLPDSACERTLVPLTTVNTDADTVVWRWQGGGQGQNFNERAVFTQSGYQPVTWQGIYLGGCGSIPMEDSIYINFQTPAIFTAEQIPCSKFVELKLGSNTDSCAFFIGDSLYFDLCNGDILWDAPDYAVYDFTLYATQPNHCDDTLALTVDVRLEPTLFLANAFSPNGDDINELWPSNVEIPEAGYEVEIYDRWGTMMWTSTDPAEQWDGTYGGTPAPFGVYVYTMRHRDPCELTREITKKGHVTIVR